MKKEGKNNKLIIFNWKMAPDSAKEAERLLLAYRLQTTDYSKKQKAEIVIAPPFVYLADLKTKKLKNLKLGAQDCFYEEKGAYTGEISAEMLKNLGVEYVIIGHSERRKYLNETDEMINKKVFAALKAGLKVVLCVGEPIRNISNNPRIKSNAARMAKNYIKKQLQKDLKNLSLNLKSNISNSRLIIAYEPVWAISGNAGGHSDTPKDVVEMIKYIKRLQTTDYGLRHSKVLYGGSVNGKNIKDFISHKEIDGVLVGGASLKKEEIKRILKYED